MEDTTMTEQQQKIAHAMDELKRARDELRVKLNLLGKDARDVLGDAENRVRKLEAKIAEVGEATLKEVAAAVTYVREKLAKAREQAEQSGKKEEIKTPPKDASTPTA
jgi:uncharacterized coiled-coil protein SlyX